MPKRFLALARVSSREQQREGFSLEVQEEALLRFATQRDGAIVKFYKVAETASKREERKAFKDLISYAKQHADKLDGILFLKVDRAARNLIDYVELERLEVDYNLPVFYVSQPTENTPAGRMMRRTLANMAAFFTEQQSLDVREGISRRVHNGLFPNRPPYGYQARRIDGRSIVEVNPAAAAKVRRIFDLYAYHGHTLDSLLDQIAREGIAYTNAAARFPRSKLHQILQDRSYIGDIKFRGQWCPGTHQALVDRSTFDRVQELLGESIYHAHELTYAGNLIACGHCGHPLTGEEKTKQTKKGPKRYVYYRCAKYNAEGHPRFRVTESDLDGQVLALFDRLRIDDEDVRDWFAQVLRARTRAAQQDTEQQVAEFNRQVTNLRNQQDRLLNLRLLDEVDESTFAAKNTELRDRIAHLNLQLESSDRHRAECGEIALKAFELSQTLRKKWLNADRRVKRQLLDIVCLNFSLDGVTLVPTIRKPFDVLVKGLEFAKSRGDRI